jgi:HKD family nuclease
MITTDLFNEVLISPLSKGADKLLIVSGYATSAMAFHHLEEIKQLKNCVEIELIVGMTVQDGLPLTDHKGFQKLSNDLDNFQCSYLAKRPPVHSKVYVWLKENKPLIGFTGSANYTQNAFLRVQREVLTECDAEAGLDYFQSLTSDTIYCDHQDAEDFVQVYRERQKLVKSRKQVVTEKEEQLEEIPDLENLSTLNKVCVSFLDRYGNLPKTSGLNWGQRRGREPNQAYIKLPSEVYHTDFFPERTLHFTVLTDDNRVLICTRAQDNGKAIHTPHNNSLLGEYFRNRLGVPFGNAVQTSDLLNYGRTDVCFYKIDDETYHLDFS